MSSAATAGAAATTGSSYWCYRCSRFVRVWSRDAIVCPECDGGFLEEAEMPMSPPFPTSEPRRRRVPATVMWVETPPARPGHHPSVGTRRSRRSATGDRSPFNPVIVLRSNSDGGAGGGDAAAAAAARPTSSFELYYDDGAGSGLRPLPASMSDFLMGSGFDRLLDQLAQIELSGVGGRSCDHPPASKAAVESMPTIEIAEDHVVLESHCAVCKEPFELGAEARQMPCKHIYHQDCILPWLSLRNSCPVCRHEMPTDVQGGRGAAQESDGDEQAPVAGSEEDAVGLTIWRLPGGGFAVGRFSGGRRAGERELPVVYTEMDGGFNTSGAPRRISWTSRGSRSRNSGGIGRAFHNFFSFFRRLGSSSSSSSSSSTSSRVDSESGSSTSRRSRSASIFSRRSSRRRNTGWELEDNNGSGISRW